MTLSLNQRMIHPVYLDGPLADQDYPVLENSHTQYVLDASGEVITYYIRTLALNFGNSQQPIRIVCAYLSPETLTNAKLIQYVLSDTAKKAVL